MNPPNIILVMSDNQQAAMLGCYGNPEIHSPNLDRLAQTGLRFDRAYCPNAFCSPCRASALTGMLPSGHGIHSWIDDRNRADWPRGWHALDGIDTLPEALKRLGYRTGIFGKYHLGETASAGAGWDDWVTMEDGHVRSFYRNRIHDNGHSLDQPEDRHAVDVFADRALEFIGSSRHPYFAFVPFPAPYGHWPATRDGIRNRWSGHYDECPVASIPRSGLSSEAVAHYDSIRTASGGGLDFSMLMRAPNDLPTLRNYFSQISLVDEAVGRIARAAPDALILFTADHGLSLGQHGFWGHGAATFPSNLHRAAHSIPLIANRAGQVPAGRIRTLVSGMDLYATILDYAGGQPDQDRPSRSFAALLRGETPTDWGPDEVFSEQEETRVIRTPEWAFFRRFRTGRAPELPDALFNVADDPDETVNLAGDTAHAAVAAGLSARIDAFFDRHSRGEADLWCGGRPIQNSMITSFWRRAWGEDWTPVYAYR